MRYWRELEWDNTEQIAAGVQRWIEQKGLLSKYYFWNTISVAELNVRVPVLKTELSKHGFTATYAALVCVATEVLPNVHVDDDSYGLGVKARINIPIMNTDNSWTVFYSARKEDIRKETLRNGVNYWWLEHKDCKAVDRVQVLKPTVLRTSEPHAVWLAGGKKPRVTLTLRVTPDPVYLLDEVGDAALRGVDRTTELGDTALKQL